MYLLANEEMETKVSALELIEIAQRKFDIDFTLEEAIDHLRLSGYVVKEIGCSKCPHFNCCNMACNDCGADFS